MSATAAGAHKGTSGWLFLQQMSCQPGCDLSLSGGDRSMGVRHAKKVCSWR